MTQIKKLILATDNRSPHPIPVLGKVIPLKPEAHIYRVKEVAIIGKNYQITCPECQKMSFVKASEVGNCLHVCKRCHSRILFKGIEKAKPVKKEPQESEVNVATAGSESTTVKFSTRNKKLIAGQITWGNIFNRNHYNLREGENYIGRQDESLRSDVSLKDDYASRRSVLIDVKKGSGGFTFRLTVKAATNPVFVNSRPYNVGDGVYLNFGDTIQVGNTKLTFKAVK